LENHLKGKGNIPKHPNPTRIQQKAPPCRHRQTQPPRSKTPQNMGMRNQNHVPTLIPLLRLPMNPPNLLNQSIHPFLHILRTFAPRTSILPDIPTSPSAFLDFVGGNALVVAVVPFAEERCYSYWDSRWEG